MVKNINSKPKMSKPKTTKYVPDKGDIVWLNFEPQKGKEIKKTRPALILSPKEYNRHGLAVACPITSKVKSYPFEVRVKNDAIDGAVLADHLRNLDWIERKAKFIAKASREEILQTLKLIGVLLKP
jgi:mRNA interferase MazF